MRLWGASITAMPVVGDIQGPCCCLSLPGDGGCLPNTEPPGLTVGIYLEACEVSAGGGLDALSLSPDTTVCARISLEYENWHQPRAAHSRSAFMVAVSSPETCPMNQEDGCWASACFWHAFFPSHPCRALSTCWAAQAQGVHVMHRGP